MAKHRNRIQVNVRLTSDEKARLQRDASEHGYRSVADYLRATALARSSARTYTLEIEPAEEGGYIVTCPALGCVTQGETYEEAVAMGADCVQGWIEAMEKLGEPVPIEPEPKRKTKAAVRVKVAVAA